MNTTTHVRLDAEPTEAEIQHAAYMLWLEEGKPEGRAVEHWHAAQELLRHHHGRDGGDARRHAPRPPAKPAART